MATLAELGEISKAKGGKKAARLLRQQTAGWGGTPVVRAKPERSASFPTNTKASQRPINTGVAVAPPGADVYAANAARRARSQARASGGRVAGVPRGEAALGRVQANRAAAASAAKAERNRRRRNVALGLGAGGLAGLGLGGGYYASQRD